MLALLQNLLLQLAQIFCHTAVDEHICACDLEICRMHILDIIDLNDFVGGMDVTFNNINIFVYFFSTVSLYFDLCCTRDILKMSFITFPNLLRV